MYRLSTSDIELYPSLSMLIQATEPEPEYCHEISANCEGKQSERSLCKKDVQELIFENEKLSSENQILSNEMFMLSMDFHDLEIDYMAKKEANGQLTEEVDALSKKCDSLMRNQNSAKREKSKEMLQECIELNCMKEKLQNASLERQALQKQIRELEMEASSMERYTQYLEQTIKLQILQRRKH